MEASTACIFNHGIWNSSVLGPALLPANAVIGVKLLKMAGPQFSHIQSEKLCVLPPRKVGIQRRCMSEKSQIELEARHDLVWREDKFRFWCTAGKVVMWSVRSRHSGANHPGFKSKGCLGLLFSSTG